VHLLLLPTRGLREGGGWGLEFDKHVVDHVLNAKDDSHTQAANNESSEVCVIIKPGRRVKMNGHRQ